MSSSQAQASKHTKPREDIPVYRCKGSYWHFHPTKYDNSIDHLPKYLWNKDPESGKFPEGCRPIYVQGHGATEHQIDEIFLSGFYTLNRKDPKQYCMGRYPKGGVIFRMYYREEELSNKPWGDAKGKNRGEEGEGGERPPGYEEVVAGSSSEGGKEGREVK